jgi:uncharacterized integral membrane protein
MKPVKWLALLLSMVLLIVFLFQNYEAFLAATTLEFRLRVLPPLNSGPIPLYALILGSIFGGGVMTTLYLGLGNLRLRKTLRSLKRQNNSLQEELKSLRNLPITEAEVPVSLPTETPESEVSEEAEGENSR